MNTDARKECGKAAFRPEGRAVTGRSPAALVFAMLALCAGAARAGRVDVAPPPPSPYADAEAETHVALAPWSGARREFAVSLTLAATPTNGVELAFGRDDSPADGRLSPAESDLRIGWDAGRWFYATPSTRGRVYREAAPAAGDVRTLSLVVQVRADDSTGAARISDGDGPVFADVPAADLRANEWDRVGVTVRGHAAQDATVLVRDRGPRLIMIVM